MQLRLCADRVHEEWWEVKVEDAEKLYESAVSPAQDDSLLKNLSLLIKKEEAQGQLHSAHLRWHANESHSQKVGKMVGPLLQSQQGVSRAGGQCGS